MTRTFANPERGFEMRDVLEAEVADGDAKRRLLLPRGKGRGQVRRQRRASRAEIAHAP
jgi:hypothetical protein